MSFLRAILGEIFTTTTTTRVAVPHDAPPNLRQAVERFKTVHALAPLSPGSRSPESLERIRSEIYMIAPRFAKHEGVNWDERNGDWIMVPKYPLPAKWRARWCRLLMIMPGTYPLNPPIGFYLNRNFKLNDGMRDDHLIGFGHDGAADLREHGWYWYCVRVREGAVGGWRPSARYDQPDNLTTVFDTVREVLTND
jgi:hypothetical protein